MKDALQVMGGSERWTSMGKKQVAPTKRRGDGRADPPWGPRSFVATGNTVCTATRKCALPSNFSAVKAELGFLPMEKTPLAT